MTGSNASRDPGELAALAIAEGLMAETAPDVTTALDRIAALPGDVPRVLICGSLYLAGTVLSQNGTPPV